MLSLSMRHNNRTVLRIYILSDADEPVEYSEGDLGTILDWLDDEDLHEICLRTGTKMLVIELERRSDQQRTVR